MTSESSAQGRILVLSIHGYVAAEPELGKPDTGGQVMFVLELARCFASLGYGVDVVTRRFEEQPERDRLSSNLGVWRIPFGGAAFIRKEDMHDHLDEFMRNFLREVRARNIHYDFVASHYWDAGWTGQRIAEELRIPHIHTPHSLGSWKKKDMAGTASEDEKKGFRFEERIKKEFVVYRSADHVIATTHQQVGILHRVYGVPEERLSMLPPGIDEQRFVPIPPAEEKTLRRRLGFRQHDVYTVGRAATNKGYDLLIRCLPALRQLVPDARLKLAVGANSAQDRRLVTRWQTLTEELGLQHAVSWFGYIQDQAMPDHYRAGAVFALPSRYEPFGMTAVEAMACGTPTVVTVHGGLHEMIDFGRQALYADPKRPAEFAALLSLPLRYSALRERLSVEGARFARRFFSWRGIARRTLELFERFRGCYEDAWERPAGAARPAEHDSSASSGPPA